MSAHSPIEWTDATWTPIRARVKENAAEIARAKGYDSLVSIATKMAGRVGPHCEKVSEECSACYSEANGCRLLQSNGTGLPFDRRSRDLVDIFVDEKFLVQPLHWKKPRRVFVCSQTDLFADFVTDDMIDLVFAVMALCPQHTFQVLTKRSKRLREYFGFFGGASGSQALFERGAACGWWLTSHGFTIEQADAVANSQFWRGLPNVWLGVSAGGQQWADERIPDLLATPAAVRFLSAEPLLGLLDVSRYLCGESPRTGMSPEENAETICVPWTPSLNWVIVGGESGREARPMHPDWARPIQRQCAKAGVPFFLKQWGEYHPAEISGRGTVATKDGRQLPSISYSLPSYCGSRWGELVHVGRSGERASSETEGAAHMVRVGKKKAGRLLDGRTWDEMPIAAMKEAIRV